MLNSSFKNEELEILIKKETVVRFIKSQRLHWAHM